MHADGRPNNQLRPITITRNFTEAPAASVLWQQGKTIVLCTASIEKDVPPWFGDDRPGGWVTADYVMLPASTPRRKDWPKIGHTDSRGTEIQRIVGRTLRAAIDLTKIGPHTIHLDCQVLQADGGTRTASICGAYVALVEALRKFPRQPPTPTRPLQPLPARFDPEFYKPGDAVKHDLAAVSVGIVEGKVLLDLDYSDDSRAEVDLNIAWTSAGHYVEIQGNAENAGGFDRAKLLEMIDLATEGCRTIIEQIRQNLRD